MKKIIAFLLMAMLATHAYADDDDSHSGADEVDEVTNPSPSPAPGASATPPSSGSHGRRSEMYSPQQAISDALSEPLTFVGRGIPDPILDKNGQVMTEGASFYCVYKNSKVYVTHHGCGANSTAEIPVLDIEVFRRSGQSVSFYAESNSGSYSISNLGSRFAGTWRLGFKKTAMINGELSLERFFEYYNAQNKNYNAGACSYGRLGPNGSGAPQFVCSAMPEQNSFRGTAASVYSAPASARFTEFHDAIRSHARGN